MHPVAPYQPMLAAPMSKAQITDWHDWFIEEKFDGWRLIVQVEDNGDVHAWTRPRRHAGSDGKTMAYHELAEHLKPQLALLPVGVYDGELLGGDTSTDVSRTDLVHTRTFVIFDVLMMRDASTLHDYGMVSTPYEQRRALLDELALVVRRPSNGMTHVRIAEAKRVTREEDVLNFVHEVWHRGGEGAILKRASSRYFPGKRRDAFVKIKKLNTAVLTVVGFEETRGTVLNRGQYATVILEDARGERTSVKTKDDLELARLNAHTGTTGTHPALGRKLRIEYQDWTPKGGYRHPRWDRWEDE